MSRIYNNGYTIEYPEALAYAGMPAIVRVSNLDNTYIGVGLTIKVGADYYTEVREPFNGAVAFDISRYMQMAFVGKDIAPTYGNDEQGVVSRAQANISVVVALTDSAEALTNVLSFDVNALIGYMTLGRANGGVMRGRRWFVNYPQTFPFYGEDHLSVTLLLNGAENELPLQRLGSEIQQVEVELSQYRSAIPENTRTATLLASEASYINGDKFNVATEASYLLTIDRCKQGVYLRWLDNTGQWCYYLFRVTGRSYATKEEQSWQDGILRSDLDNTHDVYMSSAQPHQRLSAQESISLGAKLVDAETFDYLLSLASSPIVEVFANPSEYFENNTTTPLWERVSIVAGTYARNSAPLQDFVLSIARAAHNSQML